MDHVQGIEADIFQYVDVVDVDVGCLLFRGCCFKRDFGPWLKGERVDSMRFDFSRSVLSEYRAGTLVKETRIKVIPVE